MPKNLLRLRVVVEWVRQSLPSCHVPQAEPTVTCVDPPHPQTTEPHLRTTEPHLYHKDPHQTPRANHHTSTEMQTQTVKQPHTMSTVNDPNLFTHFFKDINNLYVHRYKNYVNIFKYYDIWKICAIAGFWNVQVKISVLWLYYNVLCTRVICFSNLNPMYRRHKIDLFYSNTLMFTYCFNNECMYFYTFYSYYSIMYFISNLSIYLFVISF